MGLLFGSSSTAVWFILLFGSSDLRVFWFRRTFNWSRKQTLALLMLNKFPTFPHWRSLLPFLPSYLPSKDNHEDRHTKSFHLTPPPNHRISSHLERQFIYYAKGSDVKGSRARHE
ncbi:hypothetical protein FB446DRAFT_221888 [Lentinula raphanica]|nr:hypothetical protein FB446DRAFT_221888 [Lentinula raphanica]